jgi:ribosomal protein S18 acetylase RimI-like enzyme
VEVLVREACPADRPQVTRVFVNCRSQNFSWLPASAISLDDFNLAVKDERLFVAVLPDGAICGFLSLWEPGQFIHYLFIDPAYQGCHIANRLVKHLFPIYRQPYRLKCLDLNLRALKYYRREGWVEVGRGIDKDGGHRVLELG